MTKSDIGSKLAQAYLDDPRHGAPISPFAVPGNTRAIMDEHFALAHSSGQAHSLPGDVGTALPRLDDGLIIAAMKGHYGKAGFNIDGIDLTANDVNWTFRDGFKRMWAGVRKELKRRAALTPSALSGDAGAVETTGCNYCGAQVALMGVDYLERIAEALDAAGAPRKSPDGLVHFGLVDRIAALASHKGAGE